MKVREYAANLLIASTLILFGTTYAVDAQDDTSRITVEISKKYVEMAAAEWIDFFTILQNTGTVETPILVAHLSIAGLIKGQHVDPEDWSPVRTQYLPPLKPGQSVKLNWQIHALFKGKFSSYITIISDNKLLPLSVSPVLQLKVLPDNILPVEDVIPTAAIVPMLPFGLLIAVMIYTHRRSRIE